MKNIRELTVLQYQEETGLSKDKILYKIKKGEINAEKKKFGKQEKWIIKTVEKPTKKTLFTDGKPTEHPTELEKLKLELAETKGELKGKNELITELKQSKQEQAEHINTLKLTCNLLERENQRLLEKKPPKNKSSNENEAIVIKEKPRPQKEETNTNKANEKNMLDLSKILLDKGLNEKERKRVKARFNKRVGTREITKDKKGKIYISPNEDYSDLLKL